MLLLQLDISRHISICSHRGVECLNMNQRVLGTVAPTSDMTPTMTSPTRTHLMTRATWRLMNMANPQLESAQIFFPFTQFLKMVCQSPWPVFTVSLLLRLSDARPELKETSLLALDRVPCLPCPSINKPVVLLSLPPHSLQAAMNLEDPGHSRSNSNR